MIRYFYTGVLTSGAPQPEPASSRGGYVSSTPLRGGVAGGLLPDLSLIGLQTERPCLRLLALKNDSPAALEDFQVAFGLTDPASALEVAFVMPALDDQGREYFEQVEDPEALPLYAQLAPAADGSTFALGAIPAGQVFGMWIRRVPLAWEPTPAEELELKPLRRLAKITLIVSWDGPADQLNA